MGAVIRAQMLRTENADGVLHRIGRRGRRSQRHQFDEFVEARRQRRAVRLECMTVQRQFGHGHAVLGERSGLVRRQHRDGPQCFHRGQATGQHPVLCDTPGAQGEKDGEDDRELLGQDRDRQRDAR